jgi:predicted DNA-binding protein (UPF0251 family)
MLLEQSIHHFDLLRYCYDSEVESLVADSWRPSWSTYEHDCCVSALFRFENGARVNYLGTWTASWNKMSFSWRTEFASGVLIQRSQFGDLVRVDFDPTLGLSGHRFKSEEEAEPSRAEDLPPCIPFIDDSRLLLEEFSQANQKALKGFTPAAMDAMVRYDWPGNVRELRNAIESAVVLTRSDYVDTENLPLQLRPVASPDQKIPAYQDMPLEEVEKLTILNTLKSTGGNKSEAARRLGITRKTLHQKIKRYGAE